MPNELEPKSPFLREPWLASQLQNPNTVFRISPSRNPKESTEDSLFAEILKTDRTIQSCLSFYVDNGATTGDGSIGEVTTLIAMGNGMNGHPHILHGGITATLLDECMGIFQSVVHSHRVGQTSMTLQKGPGKDGGDDQFVGTFTVELKVRYLAPVRTPGCVEVKVVRVKKEGRKEWLKAEVRQWVGEHEGGKAVLVADGEALFITPRAVKI